MTHDEIKAQVCRTDFYEMFKSAMESAGGNGNFSMWNNMRFEDVVKVIAQNGLRIVYDENKHMNAVQISWVPTKQHTKSPKQESSLVQQQRRAQLREDINDLSTNDGHDLDDDVRK